ncbi:MAG: cell division protein FtsQ/DivIB [Gaiellaceae bacterium]
MATTSTRPARQRAVVTPLRGRGRRRVRDLHAFVPSAKALAVVGGLTLVLVGLYLIARESSLFAIQRIEVQGAPPALQRQLDKALEPFRGRSLMALDGAAVEHAALSLPDVASVDYDRAFPNTLRVTVRREHAVAVLRKGADSWLLAASGKVVRPLELGTALVLPRIWLPAGVPVTVGEPVAEPEVKTALRALSVLARRGRGLHVASVQAKRGELMLMTRSGIEIDFGGADQPLLKLTLAGMILPGLPRATPGDVAYLDLSVPDRPVSGERPARQTAKGKTQVGGGG